MSFRTDSSPPSHWWSSLFASSTPHTVSVHEPTDTEVRTSSAAQAALTEQDDLDAFPYGLSNEVASLGTTALAVPAGIGALVAYGYAKIFPEATSKWIRYALAYGAGIHAQHPEDIELVQENLQKVSENFLELVGIKPGSQETTIGANLLELAIGSSKLFGAGHGATIEREWALDRDFWITHLPNIKDRLKDMAAPLQALREKEAACAELADGDEKNRALVAEKQARVAYNQAKLALIKATGQSLRLLMPALSNWLTDKSGRDSGAVTREIVQYMSDEEINGLCMQLERVVTCTDIDQAVEAIRKIDILPKLLIFAWNKRIVPSNRPQYTLTFHRRDEVAASRLVENDEDYLRQILTTKSQDEAIRAIQKFTGARVPQVAAFLAELTGDALPSQLKLTEAEKDSLEKAVRSMIEAPLPSISGKDQNYNRLRSIIGWFNVKKDLEIPEKYGETLLKPEIRQVSTKAELQESAALFNTPDLDTAVDQFLDHINQAAHGEMSAKLTRDQLRTQVCLDRTVVVDSDELSPHDTTQVVQVLKLPRRKQQYYIQRELLKNALIVACSGNDPILIKALCTHVLNKEHSDTLLQDLSEALRANTRQFSKGFTKALLVTTLDPNVDEQPIQIAEEFTQAAQELAKSTLSPTIRIMHGTVVPEKFRLTNEQLENFISKTKELIDTLQTDQEGALMKKGLEVAASGFPFLHKVLKEAMPEGYEVHLTEQEAKLCEDSLKEGNLFKFLMYACGFIAAPLADKSYVDEISKKFNLDSVLTRYLPRLLQLSDKDQVAGLAESALHDYATIRKVTDIAAATKAYSREELAQALEDKQKNAPLGHTQFATIIASETKNSLKRSLKPLSSLNQPISFDSCLVNNPDTDPDQLVFVIGELGDQAVYLSWNVLESHVQLALLQVCETITKRLDDRFGQNLSLDEQAWKAAGALTPTLEALLASFEKFKDAQFLNRESYFNLKDKDRYKFAQKSAQELLVALLGEELNQLQMPLLTRHVVMELLVGDSFISEKSIQKYEDKAVKNFLVFIRGGFNAVVQELDADNDLPIITRIIEKKVDARLTNPEYLSGILHEQLHDIVQSPEFQNFDLPKAIAKSCVTTVFKTLFPFLYPAKKKVEKTAVDPHLRKLVGKTSDVALRQFRPKIANSWLYRLANKLGAVDAAYDSLTVSIQEGARTTLEEKLQKAGKTGSVQSGDLFLLVSHLVKEDESEKAVSTEKTKVSKQELLVDDITKIYMKGGFISQSKTIGGLVKGAIGWSFAETIKGLFLSIPQMCSYALNVTTSRVLRLFSKKSSRKYNQHITDRVNRFWEHAKTSFDHIGHSKAYDEAQKEVKHVIAILEEKDLLVHTITTLLPECIELLKDS